MSASPEKPSSRTRGAKRKRQQDEEAREDYECPVCMELPSGAVHLCPKGHRICKSCDERLEARRCPVCRAALPLFLLVDVARPLLPHLSVLPCVFTPLARYLMTRRRQLI